MNWPKPESNICIYALCCPFTDQIKYIGQTKTGLIRIKSHWRDFRPSALSNKITKVKYWIKSLKDQNIQFKVKYLEYCNDINSLNKAEIYWIKYYKNQGLDLLNHTDGGQIGKTRELTKQEKTELSKKTRDAMWRPDVRRRYLEGYKNRHRPKKYKSGCSKERKIKIRNSSYHLTKAIKCTDENGNIFNSLREAANYFNTDKSTISNHLKGLQKNVKGHTLKKL